MTTFVSSVASVPGWLVSQQAKNSADDAEKAKRCAERKDMDDYMLYHGDCLDVMNELPGASIDLVVTSPPYWNQREYSFWPTYADYLDSVRLWISGLFRLLKPGRHVFWVIPDKLPWPTRSPVPAHTRRLSCRLSAADHW